MSGKGREFVQLRVKFRERSRSELAQAIRSADSAALELVQLAELGAITRSLGIGVVKRSDELLVYMKTPDGLVDLRAVAQQRGSGYPGYVVSLGTIDEEARSYGEGGLISPHVATGRSGALEGDRIQTDESAAPARMEEQRRVDSGSPGNMPSSEVKDQGEKSDSDRKEGSIAVASKAVVGLGDANKRSPGKVALGEVDGVEAWEMESLNELNRSLQTF